MIFAANLKCNHTRASFRLYAERLNEFLSLNKREVFVFPPSIALTQGICKFTLGVQNFYPCVNGAFTGELGKEHLDEFGIKTVLIGHSERRALGDNDELIKQKFDFAKQHNYNIIFCIGENIDTKKENKTKDFLAKQLKNIDLDYKNLIIAYEPIYSIGTGLSANTNDIDAVLSFLRQKTRATLLYGGSVSDKNIDEIFSIKDCGGVLVGSFSLDVEKFITLLKKDTK